MSTIQLSLSRYHQKPITQGIVVFLFWTMLAAIFTTKTNLYYTLKGVPTSWIHLSIHHLASAWTWVLFTPVLYWIYKRLTKHSIWSIVAWLILLIPTTGVLHRVMALILDIGFRRYMDYIEGSIWQHLVEMDSLVVSGLFDSSITTIIILIAFLLIDTYWSSRKTSQIEVSPPSDNRLQVKQNGEFIFIDPSRLMSVTAEGNYVKLHLSDQNPIMVRDTMTGFLTRLDSNQFLRINRSFITNVNFVESLRHQFNGEYRITLKNGTEANTSKRFGDSWKGLLK